MNKTKETKLSIGYHYTSKECWEKIQTEGLQPYTIHRREFIPYFKTDSVNGIWVWDMLITGLAHRGCILYQMAYKNTINAVLLRVRFDRNKILHEPGHPENEVLLEHYGHIENLKYHTGEEEAVIVLEPIPPSRIELIERYCLLDAWKEGSEIWNSNSQPT
jgi:hypothetical protein